MENTLIPVVAHVTEPAGVFLVSEPADVESESAEFRIQLEKELTHFINKKVAESNGSFFNPEERLPLKNDLVVVSVPQHLTYLRGKILKQFQRRNQTLYSVLLVDWGKCVEVPLTNIRHLPRSYSSLPFCSRYAVLWNIKAVTKKLNDETLQLQSSLCTSFDESARRFIEDNVQNSIAMGMEVKGEDDLSQLHICLYLKSSPDSTFYCLNDKLCAMSYAVPSVSENVKALGKSSNFWNDLLFSPSSMKSEILGPKPFGLTVYAKELGKLNNINKLKGQTSGGSSHSPRSRSDILLECSMNLPPRTCSSPTSLPQNLEACKLAKSVNTPEAFGASVATTPKFGIGRGRFLLTAESLDINPSSPLMAQTNGMTFPISSHLTESAVNHSHFSSNTANVSGYLSSSDSDFIVEGKSFGSDKELVSVGRGSCRTSSADSSISKVFQSSIFNKIGAPGGATVTTPGFLPAGSQQLSGNVSKKSWNKLGARPRLTESRMFSRFKQFLSPPKTAVEFDPSTSPTDKKPQSEMSNSSVELNETKDTQIQKDLNDVQELLELVSHDSTTENSNSSKESINVPPTILQLSKLVEHIEERRVLVHDTVRSRPSRWLNEIPFNSKMVGILSSNRIQNPTTIQTYVWKAVLSGLHVAYVSGPRTGKTLGYLVPIMNNLLDKESYSDVPQGCSPIVIVICESHQAAETVRDYCSTMMRGVPGFRSSVLYDGTRNTINDWMGHFINGVTLLAATAPALCKVMEEGRDVVTFDRCCHLILENADRLLQEYRTYMKPLFQKYHESVRKYSKASVSSVFVPRQVIACAEHWTPGMESLVKNVMVSPSIYISSCLEAAVYGKMKLDVRRGTAQEMENQLLEIIQKHRDFNTIVFCRSVQEVKKLEAMLVEMGIHPLVAHGQCNISALNTITDKWNDLSPALLLCTDDVLDRLLITNAKHLIHYYIPQHSKYDFSYRLSFSMAFLKASREDNESAESHLLITPEFHHSLLTIVRLQQRCGYEVPFELFSEACLSFYTKEVKKETFPLCIPLKAFGMCRNMSFCPARHVILKKLDRPKVPVCGIVRVHITAVHSSSRFYARILKHRGADNRICDMRGSYVDLFAEMRKYFLQEEIVRVRKVEQGKLYAWCNPDNTYLRVRVEKIVNFDHEEIPEKVGVLCIDKGDFREISVRDLCRLPDHLQTIPPQTVEIFLVGIKPVDSDTTWNRFATEFVKQKIYGKELDGRIVLALSSTLWLSPLVERKKLQPSKSFCSVLNIRQELLNAKLAVDNPDHMEQLYRLCEIGQVPLHDYSVGLAKKSILSAEIRYAFLPTDERTEVQVSTVESPDRFYVQICKFHSNLEDLQRDIQGQINKCSNMKQEEVVSGQVCLAKFSDDDLWYRGRIMDVDSSKGTCKIFFVDHGDYGCVSMDDLKLPHDNFLSILPFQAIACSLNGIKSVTGSTWTKEAVDYFELLTRDDDGFMKILTAVFHNKEDAPDDITKGPHYSIDLLEKDKLGLRSLTEAMIHRNFAASKTVPGVSSRIAKLNQLWERKKTQQTQPATIKKETSEVPPRKPKDIKKEIFILEELLDSIESQRPRNEATNQTAVDQHSIPLVNEKNDVDIPKLKSKDSYFPLMKWAQTDKYVTVTFSLSDVKVYLLELDTKRISFRTDVNGKRYEFDAELFAEIIPEESCHQRISSGVQATLRKTKPAETWNRLISSSMKLPWLSRDFAKDFEPDEEEEPLEPLIDPDYAFEHEQSDSSSTEEFDDSDDEWNEDLY